MAIEVLTVVGPTATGKTARAVSLARAFNGEIISGDSRQVYRTMDLGTGKDLEEYGEVPYHLIDVCQAGEKYQERSRHGERKREIAHSLRWNRHVCRNSLKRR